MHRWFFYPRSKTWTFDQVSYRNWCSRVSYTNLFFLVKVIESFFFQIHYCRTFPSNCNSNSSSKQHYSPLKVATSPRRRRSKYSKQGNEKYILVSSPHITLFHFCWFLSILWTVWIFLIRCFGPFHHYTNVPFVFHHEPPQIETIFHNHS